MLIQWHGVGERNACGATWQDGGVAEVDGAAAAELLSQPGERFTVAPADPLAKIVGGHEVTLDVALLVVLCSVFTVADLAALDKEGVHRIASAMGVTNDTVAKWAEMAQEA